MTLFVTLLLFGAVALGFFLLVEGVSYIVANTGDRGESRRERRLGAVKQAETTEKLEKIAREERPKAWFILDDYVDDLLETAHSPLTRDRVYLLMVVFTVGMLITFLFLASWLPLIAQMLISVALGVAMPIIHLKMAAQKRINQFEELFPDALDLIVRSLKVGHPLGTALKTIADEMPAPLGPEFEIAARQVTYGKTPPEALAALARRMNTQDVRFLSVAVQIHHDSGGNLAEILSGLAEIIRSRFRLFRKVKALTVEGRFSAWFLSLFPIVMIFVMNGLQPGYYEEVSDFAYFPHAIVVVVILLIINVIAMKMMTKLEV